MRRFGISIYGVSRKIRTGELSPTAAFNKICDMGAEVVELVPFGFNLVTTPELKGEFKAASAARGVPIGNYSLNANFLMLTKEAYEAYLEEKEKEEQEKEEQEKEEQEKEEQENGSTPTDPTSPTDPIDPPSGEITPPEQPTDPVVPAGDE